MSIKLQIFSTNVKSVLQLLYGSETLRTSNIALRKVQVFILNVFSLGLEFGGQKRSVMKSFGKERPKNQGRVLSVERVGHGSDTH